MSWIIYKHTNLKNGKVYIGQTKQDPTIRWKNGLGYKDKDSVFAKAIKKYKWSGFKHEIIEKDIKTQEEANKRESYWIKYYKSYIGFKDCNGYNMTLGGDSGEHLGYPVYQIDKVTLKIVKEFPSTAEASRFFGNSETNASSIRNCCEGKKVSAKGYYWCYVKNYSPFWKPKTNELISPVYQIDDNFEIIRLYDSITEAVNEGYSGGTIVQCCKGKCAKANNFYWCYIEDYSEHWEPPILSFKRLEKIYCFEKNKVYKSAKQAHEDTGANTGKILRCCRGLENGANGFHFCFYKDKENYQLKTTSKREEKYADAEIELLIKYYPQMGTDVIKLLPNRTKQSIAKMASSLKIKYVEKNKHFKKVRCVEKDIVFDSIKDAALFAKLRDGSGIGLCCNGKREIAGGYHWEYVKE